MPPEENGGATPAYHKDARGAKFPDTLSPDLFVGNPAARRAYTVAATIKPYLYQQPCYCYCDRGYGHKSLLDCFVDKHGSVCGTCQQEALYTYQQLKNGKTPAQIREGIMRGDWKRLALAE